MPRIRLSRRLALLAACLVALLAAGAQAQPRYPEKSGVACDYADVLSAQTVEDVQTFHENLAAKTNVGLYVATVHFLDGQDIKTYAHTLFERWELGEKDLLLLLAVGEDNYYACAGPELAKRFPEASQQVLLSQTLQSEFMAQRYDGAVRSYLPALASALGKQFGVTVKLPRSLASAGATAAPAAAPDWGKAFKDSAFFDRAEKEAQRAAQAITREEKRSGISLGKTVLLALILWLIFGSGKGRRGRRGCGCGCAPFGWLLAALGLQKLFDRD